MQYGSPLLKATARKHRTKDTFHTFWNAHLAVRQGSSTKGIVGKQLELSQGSWAVEKRLRIRPQSHARPFKGETMFCAYVLHFPLRQDPGTLAQICGSSTLQSRLSTWRY